MARMGRAVLTAVLTVALGSRLLSPGLARADEGGIGMFPALIEMNEALRGGEYQRTITFISRLDSDTTLKFVTEGEVGSWASLHSFEDPITPLESIVARAQTDSRVLLRVVVPTDAANGLHAGSIQFESVVAEGPGERSGMSVSIGIATQLRVNVTGTQRLSGVVLDMGVADIEVDQPLRIRTMFKNTGNVKASPVIQLQVKNSQGVEVGKAFYNGTVVQPDRIELIKSEWDTKGKSEGSYIANIAVLLGDAQVDSRDFGFKILPKGTFTRIGTLDKITLESQPQAGAVAKVVAHFRNIGKIDTKAVFAAEVYRGSTLVRVVESRERVVPVGEAATLEVFFDIPESGEYVVRGKVNYEGKETEVKELTFNVQAPGSSKGSEGQPFLTWLLLGSAVAIVAAGSAGWTIWRRKRALV